MTSSQLLARVRTFLDEASAGFYTDTELYSALSAGQHEIANLLITDYKKKGAKRSEALKVLSSTLSAISVSAVGGITKVTYPSDFIALMSVKYAPTSISTSDQKPVLIREMNEDLYSKQANSYLTNTTGQYYAYEDSTGLIFETNASSGSYNITYFKAPNDIDGSTQPTLPEFIQEQIVYYATASVLKKDERFTEADKYMELFNFSIQNILY